MITSLKIEGLAIIESLHIDFSPGFNVITGETGAGKSILIRALNFLIGTKTSSEAVRKGKETATVIGEFFLPKDHQAIEVLKTLSIPFEIENGMASVLIRRVLHMNNRSVAWINDTSVSTQGLREVGATLIDVFGQHENQKLLNAKWHLKYIDSFLEKKEVKTAYELAYREAMEKVSFIRETVEGFLAHQKDQDYIQFRLEELKEFSPSAEDYSESQRISKTAGAHTKTKEVLTRAVQALETEEGDSIGKRFWEVAKTLSHPSLDEFGDENLRLRSLAEELAQKIEDLSYSLTKQLSNVDVDEAALEEAEKRVFGYQSLFRKHGVKEIEELLLEKTRLEGLSANLEEVSFTLKKELKALEEKAEGLRTRGEALSRARMKAGFLIKKAVESELKDLSMAGARFDTKWENATRDLKEIPFESFNRDLKPGWERAWEVLKGFAPEGAEGGEFLLASNPGETTLPLARIASGGELSRIMLALKKAIAIDSQTCVLVFDEIDTGISGRIADVVGQKMQELANAFQVICISHLPQVAVYADAHFLVQKVETKEGKMARTESSIIKMTSEESAKEIARLLSAESVSKTGLANAKHLIATAQGRKKTIAKPFGKASKKTTKQTPIHS